MNGDTRSLQIALVRSASSSRMPKSRVIAEMIGNPTETDLALGEAYLLLSRMMGFFARYPDAPWTPEDEITVERARRLLDRIKGPDFILIDGATIEFVGKDR